MKEIGDAFGETGDAFGGSVLLQVDNRDTVAEHTAGPYVGIVL